MGPRSITLKDLLDCIKNGRIGGDQPVLSAPDLTPYLVRSGGLVRGRNEIGPVLDPSTAGKILPSQSRLLISS